MEEIINWLNRNSDALMVIITTIYVIATIVICIANNKSALASKEQLAESKRQYEETKRLSMRPFFQFDTTHEILKDISLELIPPALSNMKSTYESITLKNIGLGAAKNIMYEFKSTKHNFHQERKKFPIVAFRASEEKNIELWFDVDDTIILNFYFEDLLENKYKQTIEIKCTSKISNIKINPIETARKNNE